MVVFDGICIGPKHCAYENCADDLTNNRDAVFWCNPAPADGSAPNLVIKEKDKQGKMCFRHAFNTQVS